MGLTYLLSLSLFVYLIFLMRVDAQLLTWHWNEILTRRGVEGMMQLTVEWNAYWMRCWGLHTWNMNDILTGCGVGGLLHIWHWNKMLTDCGVEDIAHLKQMIYWLDAVLVFFFTLDTGMKCLLNVVLRILHTWNKNDILTRCGVGGLLHTWHWNEMLTDCGVEDIAIWNKNNILTGCGVWGLLHT